MTLERWVTVHLWLSIVGCVFLIGLFIADLFLRR